MDMEDCRKDADLIHLKNAHFKNDAKDRISKFINK